MRPRLGQQRRRRERCAQPAHGARQRLEPEGFGEKQPSRRRGGRGGAARTAVDPFRAAARGSGRAHDDEEKATHMRGPLRVASGLREKGVEVRVRRSEKGVEVGERR